MDLLGVGPLELIFIFIIVILVVGPRDIGNTARSIGKFLNRLYKSDEWKSMTQASRTLRTLPQRLAREAELEELDSIRNTLKDATQELRGTRNGIAADANAALQLDLRDKSARREAMHSWTKPRPSKEESEEDPPTPRSEKP